MGGLEIDKPRDAAAESKRGPLPTIFLILLAVAGILVSGELTHIHYKVNTDPEFKSFCNMGEAVNCETVAASAWSELFGVPIAVWSLFAYLVLLGLALTGVRRRGNGQPATWPGLIFLWSVAGLGAAGVMGYISAVLVKSACILCVALYVINVFVMLVAFLMSRRDAGGVGAALRADVSRMLGTPRVWGPIIVGLAAVAVLLVLRYPDFGGMAGQPEELVSPAHAGANHEGGDHQACGSGHHTPEGFPILGEPDAAVTIEEFSDYQCGFCRRAHAVVRKLAKEYEGKLRLVHRNFPLDQSCNRLLNRPFHQHACLAAKAAICADQQNHFWDYNDTLWANSKDLERDDLLEYAEKLNLDMAAFEACLESEETNVHLQRDIRDGIGWKVTGTPSFVINGEFVQGALPEARFRKKIDEALARCAEPAAQSPSDASAP